MARRVLAGRAMPLPLRLTLRHVVTRARSVVDRAASLARATLALRDANDVGRRAAGFGVLRLVNCGELRVGSHFTFKGTLGAIRVIAESGGRIMLGDSVTIEHGTTIRSRSFVSVGDRVHIGPRCTIDDASGSRTFARSARGIMVGSDVVLGAGVTLLPGVRIGDRVVISAGTVVDRDIDGDTLIAGTHVTAARSVRRPQAIRSSAHVLPTSDHS